MKVLTQNSKEYQDHIPCSFANKLVCVDDKFSKSIIIVFRYQNAAYEFIQAILKEYLYRKKVMKKHLNKTFITSEEEEEQLQSSNSCWICEKFIDNDDKKVRDHCHITGKFRDAANWSCNIRNLTDDDFKHLTEEFRFKKLELLKKNVVYPYEYMDSFKRFSKEKLPDEK